MADAIWLSLGVIFVAELGDKSQLLALALATRYRPWPVLGGVALAMATILGLSVGLGALLAEALPTRALNALAGLAFLGFGLWTLRREPPSATEARRAGRGGRSALKTTAAAFFVAELGDKTMLATITLAATHHAFGTWLGATLGIVSADALAILVGRQLSQWLPERTVRIGAAVLFFIFGALLIYDAVAG